MTSTCEKKISAEVWLIYAEQIFLRYSFKTKNKRHKWRLNKSGKTF